MGQNPGEIALIGQKWDKNGTTSAIADGGGNSESQGCAHTQYCGRNVTA